MGRYIGRVEGRVEVVYGLRVPGLLQQLTWRKKKRERQNKRSFINYCAFRRSFVQQTLIRSLPQLRSRINASSAARFENAGRPWINGCPENPRKRSGARGLAGARRTTRPASRVFKKTRPRSLDGGRGRHLPWP